MGNKSSSSLTTVHDYLSTRKRNKLADSKSTDASPGDDASRMVDDIAECIDSYSGDYAKLNSKDIKLLASIATLLADELCGLQPDSSSTIQLSGRLKAIAAVHKLLQIPFVSKNALENCLLGLVNCLSPSHAESLCLSLNCICTGVVSANEDAFKCSICLQLESLSFYEIMLKNLDIFFKSSTAECSNGSQFMLYAVLIYSQHLVWILGQQLSASVSAALSTTFKSFQKRLASQISKHLDSIFELTRHEDDAIQFAATMLLIQVLSVQERRQCSNIQVRLMVYFDRGCIISKKQYCTVLYCIVLYCTVLYCTVLYCTVLYCTELYCTVLYCTVLY